VLVLLLPKEALPISEFINEEEEDRWRIILFLLLMVGRNPPAKYR